MARKFVSPGVFTNEVDKSYLAQGVANIGAGVIGLTAKGPAFSPLRVTSKNDFVAKFGDVSTTLVAPYAAMNYLTNAEGMLMIRVLGTRDGNTSLTNGSSITATFVVDSAGKPLAEVHFSNATSFTLNQGGSVTGFSGTFAGLVGSTATTSSYTASFAAASSSFIKNILNFDPTKISQYGHYVYKFFEWAGTGSGGVVASASISGASGTPYDYDFTTPETPWILSQNGAQLFKFVAVADGASANTDIKVLITGIKASANPVVTKYGTFDVVVRQFSDTDNRVTVVEQFTACTLDPNSVDYLPRRIGNQYFQWSSSTRKNTIIGTFKNKSRFITVEMAGGSWPETSLPWGHSTYPLQTGASGTVQAWPLVTDNLDAQQNIAPTYWGLDFSVDGISSLLKARAHASLTAEAPSASGTAFDMKKLLVSTTGTIYGTGSLNVPTSNAVDGFTVAFHGGFDGWNLTEATPAPTGTWSNPYLTKAFKLAVDAVSNPDEIDINLIVAPGVTDAGVTSYISTMCNNRADCMFIRDAAGSAVSDAVTKFNGIDDNYAAAYYPDLVYSDDNGNQVRVPPSVAVLGAFAYSDKVSQVWFAPAGLNRGGLAAFGITDVVDRLTFQDRNDLYDARINAIAYFPNEGIAVFGQKTLQAKPSALDRVNVRRLLIYAKKTIASTAKYLLFEPNNPNTWQTFTNTVNPILEDVRQKQGLERFKVVMDSTVNTPDLIDRNVMTGKIFLQPTKAAEFIDLSFIITASGVSFEE